MKCKENCCGCNCVQIWNSCHFRNENNQIYLDRVKNKEVWLKDFEDVHRYGISIIRIQDEKNIFIFFKRVITDYNTHRKMTKEELDYNKFKFKYISKPLDYSDRRNLVKASKEPLLQIEQQEIEQSRRSLCPPFVERHGLSRATEWKWSRGRERGYFTPYVTRSGRKSEPAYAAIVDNELERKLKIRPRWRNRPTRFPQTRTSRRKCGRLRASANGRSTSTDPGIWNVCLNLFGIPEKGSRYVVGNVAGWWRPTKRHTLQRAAAPPAAVHRRLCLSVQHLQVRRCKRRKLLAR